MLIHILKRSILTTVAVLAGLIFLTPSSADEPPKLTLLQDEPLELPQDNRAYLTAAREFSVQLDLLAALENVDDTVVTLVRPNGERSEFEPDTNSLVTITNAEPGPHVLVASSRVAHGTMFVNLKQQPDEPARPDELEKGLDKEGSTEPLRMTMLALRAKVLRPVIEELREIDTDMPLDVLDPVQAGRKYGYRVLLAKDGTLYGRVFSVMNRSLVNVDGTRIDILLDGKIVGTTTCDEAGDWSIKNMRPGVYGLIAAGRAGYTAFAFETIDDTELALRNSRGELFTSRLQPPGEAGAAEDPFQDQVAELLPVVLCPPPLVPPVIESIVDYYPSLRKRERMPLADTGEPIAIPTGGGVVPASPTSYGGPGLGSGVGTGGTDLSLASAVGLGVILTTTSDNENPFVRVIASPAVPIFTPISP